MAGQSGTEEMGRMAYIHMGEGKTNETQVRTITKPGPLTVRKGTHKQLPK